MSATHKEKKCWKFWNTGQKRLKIKWSWKRNKLSNCINTIQINWNKNSTRIVYSSKNPEAVSPNKSKQNAWVSWDKITYSSLLMRKHKANCVSKETVQKKSFSRSSKNSHN